MFLRFSLLGASSALVLSCSAVLAQQDGPPVNIQQILHDLDQIETQQKQMLQSTKQATIAKLRAAANSGQAAANLYLEAVEAIQFEGKKGRGGFATFKDSAGDAVRSKEMQTALMLHLRYIVLSIERKMSEKPEDFVQPSLAYLVELYNAESLFIKGAEKGELYQLEKEKGKKISTQDQEEAAVLKRVGDLRKELFDKPITDSVFSTWLRLAPWFPKGDNWEMTAGNTTGILEKNVRPVLRQAKNPQVIDTWEFEMKVLADRATGSRLEHQMTEFNTVVRPRLQLGRANDMAEMGQKNRAISEIYSMIKTYPQHPDFPKWVQRLREIAKTAGPAGAAAAATPAEDPAGAATPAAGTSPQ